MKITNTAPPCSKSGKKFISNEQARDQGKTASLLEQQRPNVFQMNVANILPGDTIQVDLAYTELLVPTDRVYEFVYPTVVGPRYSNWPSTCQATRDGLQGEVVITLVLGA